MCKPHEMRRTYPGHGHGHGGGECACGGCRCTCCRHDCCGCCCGGEQSRCCGVRGRGGHGGDDACAGEPKFVRRFKSLEEEIEELEEYQKELSRELSGVERRLKELREKG